MPAAGAGDMFVATVKKGKPELRKKGGWTAQTGASKILDIVTELYVDLNNCWHTWELLFLKNRKINKLQFISHKNMW